MRRRVNLPLGSGEKTKTQAPTRSKLSILRQLCNFSPNHLVPKLARETGVDAKAQTFSPWSHFVSLIYAQISHSIGLNDVCDALRLSSGPLSAVRGATAPSRNDLSYANRHRDASLAEKVFWSMLAHLQALSPEFARGRRGRGITQRQLSDDRHATDRLFHGILKVSPWDSIAASPGCRPEHRESNP